MRWPRLAYDVRRWATVFPVGMYAAMSFTIEQVSGDRWIGDFARTWTWVAVGVWAAVASGAVRRLSFTTYQRHGSNGRGR